MIYIIYIYIYIYIIYIIYIRNKFFSSEYSSYKSACLVGNLLCNIVSRDYFLPFTSAK